MKTIRLILVGFCVFWSVFAYANSLAEKEKPISEVLESWARETAEVNYYYRKLNRPLYKKLNEIGQELPQAQNLEKQVGLLVEKARLEKQLRENKAAKLSDISKIRYLKGLEVVQILYGKTLALDHHFASISTFHEISKIANPNNYPEFADLKEQLSKKEDKRQGFDLTALLGQNMYTAVIHSMVSLFANQNLSKQEKQDGLKEVECILDFTLQMHNDLNTIYFETAFLQKSNETLMKDLQQLFKDYTDPIGYGASLEDCRQNDEWDKLRDKLDVYVDNMDKVAADGTDPEKALKMRIALEFPIDRLLQFIMAYNTFIDQGTEFYEKFKIMLDSYENEQQCATKIPIAYKELKSGMDTAIEKFTTAYRPVEINGSKMKQLLYGINVYD